MRLLPSFADLMLLPPTIAPSAEVFMQDQRIAIRVPDAEQRHFLHVQLDEYPHIRVVLDDDKNLVLEPVAAPYRRLLLVWPEGRTAGVLLWDAGYYSTIDACTLEALISIGLQVQTVFCTPGRSLHATLFTLSTSS